MQRSLRPVGAVVGSVLSAISLFCLTNLELGTLFRAQFVQKKQSDQLVSFQ